MCPAPTRTELPSLPRDDEGPVFAEPWQAQVFAMVVKLHEEGVFGWPEWTERLGAEIKAAQAAGDPDTGETYYGHWLAALERLMAERALVTGAELAERRDAWARAAAVTPHGQPIRLGAEVGKS
ncbi:MAG: nitrile hydratase accessory protein [Alphaproteobacteria bacterium]|jgi:nitrile hydratase accessory protein|nr:nitrile hydratase accessory protein [Alphaproteobacteria bacterium]